MIIQRTLILFGLAMCASSRYAQSNPQLDEAWKKYKEEYGKKYEPSKEMERRMIWENNLAEFEKHNAEAEKGLHSFQLGVNQFADLTKEEFIALPPCFLPHHDDMADHENKDMSETNENTEDLPSSLDWRKEGYVTAVQDQGTCGSCYAFATVGNLEGHHKNKTGKLVELSEQNIMDCSWKYGNEGCHGGLFNLSLEYVVKNGGIDTENAYPYTGIESHKCKYTEKGKAADCKGYKTISRNEKVLATALVNHGPIAVAMCTFFKFGFYSGGIFEDPDCCFFGVNHAVLLVGYGSEKGKDYWIVKNSYGTKWGEKGYIRILRHKDVCMFGLWATYAVG